MLSGCSDKIQTIEKRKRGAYDSWRYVTVYCFTPTEHQTSTVSVCVCSAATSSEHRKLLSKDQKCSCGAVPTLAVFIELTDYINQCRGYCFFTLPQLLGKYYLP